jgi:hypothetical protein
MSEEVGKVPAAPSLQPMPKPEISVPIYRANPGRANSLNPSGGELRLSEYSRHRNSALDLPPKA